MQTIIINDEKLTDNDIQMNVIRVKGLVITKTGKILLAYNNHTYQFLGGHVEEGEDIKLSLIREIKEEAGITVEIEEDPFLNIITYDHDYFNTGRKVKNSIYYYRILSDEIPNFSLTKYDELERKSDFELYYVDLLGLEDFLKRNISSGEIDENIGREMLYALEVYNQVYGG